MTSLHHIHEASILYNLGERAKLENQRPYTFMVRPEAEGRKKKGGAGVSGGSAFLLVGYHVQTGIRPPLLSLSLDAEEASSRRWTTLEWS